MKRLLLLLLLTSSLAAEPRRFIVEFSSAPARSRFRTEAANADVEIRREYRRAFQGAAVELREGQSIRTLSELPSVVAVYPDTEVVAFGGETARGRAESPSLQVKTHAGGNGIVVAVIDTGIDGTHPALAGKVIGGYDFANNDTNPMDDHGHGTHVAGIIAAQGAEVTGVAPNARLLAYKVLNAEGKGRSSDILAAIERALDPNNDGDLSDHADVINLSLGGAGHPNDPLSRAVDNAVNVGAVVCVAAGNDGLPHRIGSPAGAAKVITVGSSYRDGVVETVSDFSTRGPATQSGAVKPDLLAPGEAIRSTGLNHSLVVMSGTSMASPYVAGLAAVLLEAHPDWTPERVKIALVTTSHAVPNEEVMAQGSGIADGVRANANFIVATPTQLNFGLDGGIAGTWTTTRRIAIRNDGATPRTIQANIEGVAPAMTVEIVPPQVTLTAGQTANVDVTIHVDNGVLGAPPTGTLAFSGVLTLAWNGDAVRLPWAFLRAGRATITTEGSPLDVLWDTDTPHYASPASLGGAGFEVLLEPGMYDFVVTSKEADELRLVFKELQEVVGDVTFPVRAADAPHEIRFAGVDDRGTPFADGDGVNTLHSLLLRLLLPRDRSVALPDITGRVIRTSSFGERYGVLATESFVDRAAASVYVAQYSPITNVTAGRLLQVSPGDYASQGIELTFPPGVPRRDVRIMPRDWTRRPLEFRVQPPSLRFAVDGLRWEGTLYQTREVHPDVASGPQFALFTAEQSDFFSSLVTPMLRRNDDGFFAAWGFANSPLPVQSVAGEPFRFGRGAIHSPGLLQASETAFYGDAQVYGARGETRRLETLTGKVRIFDEDHVEISTGQITPGGFSIPLPGLGKYTAEVKVGPFMVDDRVAEATQRSYFDTRQGTASLPALTSFAILDGVGRNTTRLPVNGNGTLVFSAADHEQSEYRRVVDAAVFFRRRGASTWIQLSPVAMNEESSADLGRSPAGVVYRVDLEDALRLGPNEYEVLVEIEDAQGNWTTWQIAPAFITEVPSTGGKRRAVGKP